ncbi:caspase family protein, partial [Thiotrichales bacterium HSG1]|nr:caspase family protein [Thiotrichales bacterium HSG1]
VGGPKDKKAIFVTHNYPYNLVKKLAINNDEVFSYWSSSGNPKAGKFYTPLKIALDKDKNVYVSDMLNNRIAKFDSEGKFIGDGGKLGAGKDEFILPGGIAIDTDEDGNTFLYVIDMGNVRIHKFQVDVNPIISIIEGNWPLQLKLNAEKNTQDFVLPTSIAVDSKNNVYVVDSAKCDIKKFDSNGNYLITFGEGFGENDGQFSIAGGIAIDDNDNVYVADSQNHRIQQFDTSGNFIRKFGRNSRNGNKEKGTFEDPSDLVTDEDGNLYVSDSGNHRVQRIKADCIKNDNVNPDCIETFGSEGSFPGQFNLVGGLAVTPDGTNIYATDINNNRIQVFKHTEFSPGKAIIISGKAYEGDTLWDSTQAVANFAYHTLLYQGFNQDEIQYLSADIGSGRGKQNFIKDKPSLSSVKNAIKWASEDNKNLTLYMVDHGGRGPIETGIFKLNSDSLKTDESDKPDESVLTSIQLRYFLNGKDENGEPIFDSNHFENIKIIYDACFSGSFLHSLKSEDGDISISGEKCNSSPSLYDMKSKIGSNWTIITSTSDKEYAYFDSQGSLSFSRFFWGYVFNGLTVEEAFNKSRNTICKKQTPNLKTNDPEFSSVRIGNGTTPIYHKDLIDKNIRIKANAPEISIQTEELIEYNENPVEIEVKVTGGSEINEVLVTIHSPAMLNSETRGGPVVKLPTFYLNKIAGTNMFTGKYDDFTVVGEHKIIIDANDGSSNYAESKEILVNVTANNLRKHYAIIVAGDSSNNENIKYTCQALKHKGFENSDIKLFFTKMGTNICELENTSELTVKLFKDFLNTLKDESIRSLVIYFEGLEFEEGNFKFDNNKLSFAYLNNELDKLQESQQIDVTTIIFEGAGLNFLDNFKDENRIVIFSNTTENLNNIRMNSLLPTFSKFFWQEIASGNNILDAFDKARKAAEPKAEMVYRKNGKNIPTKTENFIIGTDVVRASVAPAVEVESSWLQVKDGTKKNIKVNVSALEKITRVWGTVTSDTINIYDEIIFEAVNVSKYQAIYDKFIIQGDYTINIFAEDIEGRISFPSTRSKITINQGQPSFLESAQKEYQRSDTIKVTFQNPLPKGYVQYVAVELPDNRIFTIDKFNNFNHFDGKKSLHCNESEYNNDCWVGKGDTVIDIPVNKYKIPYGEYHLHLVRLPERVNFKLPPDVNTWGESFFEIKED